METSHYSVLTMSQVFTMLLGLTLLMISIRSMNLMETFQRKLSSPQELILDLLKERAETGRLYIMNIDHCNSHSSFKDKVEMSNLCQEITLPTYPINHIDDKYGEIALCILSAINVGKVRSDDELEELCDLAVRGLEELIDYQQYPIISAEVPQRRVDRLESVSLDLHTILLNWGIIMTHKKHGMQFMDLLNLSKYYLLKASNQLAKEKGWCENFGRTKVCGWHPSY